MAMRAIMADNDIQGHMQLLAQLLVSDAWRDFWVSLNLSVTTFADLSVEPNIADAALWHLCQQEQIILITGNRNKDGPDSLEATIQAFNTPTSLPVLTIADPNHIPLSRVYANRVVETMLQYL